ncbi:TAXI family TRAP transporter solute-binding subunit [Ferrovibrio sp. MS7]|uniref:TAXI family TRAP transporter solute-binding subunit n=1 Tax=Ferrovibrio plantarum TaxID=3119164 RepID=UPI003136917A
MRVAMKTMMASAVLALMAGGAVAQKLPDQLTWTAYDVGSGGYNQAVAIGNALKNKHNVTLRVLPGKNDVSRTVPLREGKVPFSANGVGGTYMAQEAVYEFGAKDWGPQPVRSLLLNNSDALLTVVAAKDTGVKTMADLKGKRVAWVIGAPSLNQNITALLAYANLTWNDVQRVEFGGFGQAMTGIINNQVDAAFASTISGQAYQIASSPRGITYPTVPHNDAEGWKRLKAKAPFYVPFYGAEGPEMSATNRVEGATYPYPVLMTYANVDAGQVYAMTKAMVELYNDYKDAAPGNIGWDIKRQVFDWVVPVHEGAVKYFKEIGVWKPEYDKNNAALIDRQKTMADAWAAYTKSAPADEAAFAKGWMKARADALAAKKLDVFLTEW